MPPATSSPRRPARSLPLVPIIAVLVVVLGVVAVVASRGSGDDDGGAAPGIEETRPVTVTGAALPPHGDGADAAIGSAAPAVRGATFDGSPLAIGDDGRPKVLAFLAHWCPHCQREVPVLVDWLAEHGDPGDIDLYGVATSTTRDRPNFPPSSWLERESWTLPTLADSAESDAARAFGLSSFPFFVALDRENRVVARVSGELTEAQWEQLLGQARG